MTRDRGQLVLAAAAVLAVALASIAMAYVGLGYDADVETVGPERDRLGDTVGTLSRAVHVAGANATGTDWDRRERAVTTVREGLDRRIGAIEGASVGDGAATTVTFAPEAAAEWARTGCPGGTDREFGTCEARGGIVVQERAGETTVLAVGTRVRVRTADAVRETTVVIRTVGWPVG
ncbi:hypothetical protein BRD17_04085 [Halobacteriales archaeon SW_7_68_16]|nr:MAG: hypothetical protein BRD17_04085 [Halobacteriales archaeon SW_7_68_16]